MTACGSSNFTSLGREGPAGQPAGGGVFWREYAGAQASANISRQGASRSSGALDGQPCRYTTFVAQVVSSSDGTLALVNEDAPALATVVPVKAGVVTTARVPALGSTFHASFTPTSPATVSLATGFTA